MCRSLNALAPPETAADWDPVGLQIGDPDEPVRRVAVCHEISDGTLDELVQFDLAVTYHPLIFRPLLRLTPGGVSGRVLRLASARTAVIAVHTNFDAAAGGTADALASALGIVDPAPFAEIASSGAQHLGAAPMIGRVGSVSSVSLGAFAGVVASTVAGQIRVAGDRDRDVSRVAVVPGSGSEFIAEAAATGADVLVTGDVGHHRARAALDAGLAIVDPGHAATERPGVAALYAAVCTIVEELAPGMVASPEMVEGRDTDPWERS